MKKLIIFFKAYFFNKRTFKIIAKKNNKIILCEFSGNKSNQLAFSYLVNAIMRKHNSKCYSYVSDFYYKKIDYLKFFFHKILRFNYGNFLLNKSFNVEKFILPKKNNYTKSQFKKAQARVNNFKSKFDLLKFKVDDILIGDLIYDSFLKYNIKYPTLNIRDKELKKFIYLVLDNFYYWKNYFKKNKIVGVVVSDTVYTDTMITRISSFYKVPTYQCNWENIHKIDEKNLYCYSKFKYYRKIFNKLPDKNKNIALKKAKENIKKRLAGGQGDDLFYTNISAFSSNLQKKKILSNNNKKKILIASHYFIDAPHAFGPKSNIFPDFYEWINYLYLLSKKTNYDWYIKCHPHTVDTEKKIFDNIAEGKKNFKIIPQNVSHLQLIREGINCVLTVRGTIAWEYAYFKIPVICASIYNPHMNYDFCIHSKNIKEYEKFILNFNKLRINFNKKNIHEFYFMHNMFSRSNWLIEDKKNFLRSFNDYSYISKMNIYDMWMKDNSYNKNIKIFNRLNKFLKNDKLFIENHDYFT